MTMIAEDNRHTAYRHTITALVEDKPGVLNRVASMFRRRGFNISSLAVGNSEIPNLSRMTFVVEGDSRTVEQVTKHLHKLIDVIKVSDISEDNAVARELALIRVHTTSQTRSDVMQIVDLFRANVIDVANDSVIVEVVGDEEKVGALQNILDPYGVLEVMRTGVVAMTRGMKSGRSDSRRNGGGGRSPNFTETGSV